MKKVGKIRKLSDRVAARHILLVSSAYKHCNENRKEKGSTSIDGRERCVYASFILFFRESDDDYRVGYMVVMVA